MLHNIDKLYIFEGFEKDFLEKIVTESKIKNYKSGEFVIKEGDDAKEAFVIIDGIVQVIKDNKTINTIFPGDIFGEIALVTNEKRTASIKAETDLKLLVISKENLIKIINNYPNGQIIKTTILNRIIQNNKN